MLKYIVKRIVIMVPVILGLSFIIFSIMSLTPGDPASIKLGEGASHQDIENLREEMGLNENFFVRYTKYIANAVSGDFGKSYITEIPVKKELLSRFPTTLKLALGATSFMILIGIPIGIVSAVKQYTIIDTMSLIGALLLTSMPIFFLGLILILLFSLKLGWLPSMGIDSWKSFILPSITLGSGFMAALVRMMRSSMLEVVRQDYIRTARAKGAGEKRVIFKHALRNALLPAITVIGLNFGAMLGGTIITESIFGLPGVGTMTITAVRMKDTPSIMASVLFVAVFIGLINLAIDIIYTFVDPRLKSQLLK